MRRKGFQNQAASNPGPWIRFLLLIAAVLILNASASLSLEVKFVQGLTQPTQYGKVKGTTDEATGNLIWRGIKFAEAPVGEWRWRAPRKPESWQGVKETVTPCPECLQLDSFTRGVTGDEDCLFLNIFRPDSADPNLPVYVWIHGGSNETGQAPDLSFFAKEANLVAVSIQYRMGPLGFFKHDALKTGDPLEDSGNFGILDQMMALKWVKNNIAAFGGNPDKVTLAGESAGAHDILALLTIERANGLYDKAALQSGGMEFIELDKAKEQSAGYVEKLQITSTGTELARDLRAVSGELLLKAKPVMSRFGVIGDGNLIKDNPFCLVKQGRYNQVPIFMGGNRNEYSAWLLWSGGPRGKWDKLWQTLPKGGNKEVSEILNQEEKKTFALTSSLTGRLWQAQQIHSVASSMRQYQDNVFVYDYQWGGTKGSKVDFVLGASHANEIGFFHYGGNWDWMGQGTSLTAENKAARQALAWAMLTYKAQFAHSGTPNGPAPLPEWKPWSNEEDGLKTMNLDASSEPGSAELKLFMTRREYRQEDLIREVEACNDPIAQKFTRMVAKRTLQKLECE